MTSINVTQQRSALMIFLIRWAKLFGLLLFIQCSVRIILVPNQASLVQFAGSLFGVILLGSLMVYCYEKHFIANSAFERLDNGRRWAIYVLVLLSLVNGLLISGYLSVWMADPLWVYLGWQCFCAGIVAWFFPALIRLGATCHANFLQGETQ